MKRQTTVLFFLPFLVLILLSSCGRFLTSNKGASDSIYPVSTIHLQQLKSIDLSENVSRLSSQNDEILLLIYLQNDQQKILQKYQSDYIEFLENSQSREINQVFQLPNPNHQYILSIILIEQDTDRPTDKLAQLVTANLDQSQEQITALLQDDDLLGIERIAINTGQNTSNNTIKFWGIHLFDEYEYQLSFTLK